MDVRNARMIQCHKKQIPMRLSIEIAKHGVDDTDNEERDDEPQPLLYSEDV